MSLTVLSVATKITPGVQAMCASARLHGLTVRLLGLGQEWRGFGWRLRLVRDALAALPSTEVVLHVDSADVLFTGGEREILERFADLNADFVCAAEVNCWPDPEEAASFPDLGRYRYLNGGAWIGGVYQVEKTLDRFCLSVIPDDADDQRFLQDIALTDPFAITGDHEARLFQCLHAAQDHIADGRNILTGATPVIWHGNGHADMSRVYEWSGLCPKK